MPRTDRGAVDRQGRWGTARSGAPASDGNAATEQEHVVNRTMRVVSATVVMLALAVPASAQSAPSLDDGCPSGVPSAGFSDAAGPFQREIDCVAWWEVALGVTARTYEPQANVTRAQMATFVHRMVVNAGGEFRPAGRSPFTDVDGGPHGDNILRLHRAGIVQGTTPTTYAPSRTVTRGQMASFLARAWEHRTGRPLPAGPNPFTDVSGPHAENITRVARAGIALGTSPGQYRPEAPVTRGQMAAFLARTLSKLVADGHAQLPGTPAGTVRLVDLTPRTVTDCALDGATSPWRVTSQLQLAGEMQARPHSWQCRIGIGSGALAYDLDGRFGRFTTVAGIGENTSDQEGTVRFRVLGDGQELARVDVVFGDTTPAQRLDVDVTGVERLRLEVSRTEQCESCLTRGMIVGWGTPTLR
ncbi:hypothetical protein FTX61_03605 [Nitriliruptoraceae bacterium ZYF776]|nr:hypothetical protein [Profundirhabdus halotolerans]